MMETTSGRRRRSWLVPAIVAVLALIGLGIGIGVAVRDDPAKTTVSDASRIASVQQACQTWMGDATGARPSDDWCQSMAGWMNQQIHDGSMMGSMMWGDPDRMRSTCRSWATSSSSSTTSSGTASNADRWCDDMVTWMQGHMNGNWNGWMMRGGMMGR